jgi:hypothetical protein
MFQKTKSVSSSPNPNAAKGAGNRIHEHPLIEISKRSRKRSQRNRPPGNENKSSAAEQVPK